MTIRAFDYSADAEVDEMPNMLIAADWDELKDFFRNEIKRLAKEKLGIPNNNK